MAVFRHQAGGERVTPKPSRVSAAMYAAHHQESGRQAPPIRDAVLRGLTAPVKTLPASLFYDADGARLFEAICDTPEYYVTRTELQILAEHAHDIAAATGPHAAVIELGSGAGTKVRLLLDALRDPTAYVPVDISSEQLARMAAERQAEYPNIPVYPVCADYSAAFSLPTLPSGARRVAFFPGSTIGNFHPTEATAFLRRLRRMIGPTGAIILGVDRRKDPGVLHAAYNDAAGITAAFNLNVLRRINRELGAAFNPSRFAHRAHFCDATSRIEMHLVARATHSVVVSGVTIQFTAGETIHTECSYKYDAERLDRVVQGAGLRVRRRWTDLRDWFWVVLLEPDQA